MIDRHKYIVAGVLAVLAISAGMAHAGAPTDQLRQHVDRVVKILNDPAFKGPDKVRPRHTAVRKIADDIFDIPQTAKRALGLHWQPRTPAEREEFVRLFGDLLEQAYLAKMDHYEGDRVLYVGETIEGDQAIVRTRITTRQGSEIPVEYRLHLRDGRWLVYDVVIEGVSLVANYRTQFNKIIQAGSYQQLVEKLRAKSMSPGEDGRGRRS